jgi:nucleoid-associated protein YgaU
MWKYVLAVVVGYFVVSNVVLQDGDVSNTISPATSHNVSNVKEIIALEPTEQKREQDQNGTLNETVETETVTDKVKSMFNELASSVDSVKKFFLDGNESAKGQNQDTVKVLSSKPKDNTVDAKDDQERDDQERDDQERDDQANASSQTDLNESLANFRVASAIEGDEDPTMLLSANMQEDGSVFSMLEMALQGSSDDEDINETVEEVASAEMKTMESKGEVAALVKKVESEGVETTKEEVKKVIKSTLFSQVEHQKKVKKAKTKKVKSTKRGRYDKYGNYLYRVKKGDTLQSIASKFYKNQRAFVKIYVANKRLLKHKDHIQVGQVLRLPGVKR